MRISLIQENIFWADKKANFDNIEAHLNILKTHTDLVVLPEMFSTGFCVDQPQLAENMQGETIQFLTTCAQKFNLAITGSFIATENELLFNRAFFVFPDGKVEYSDKRHLFSMGRENEYFSRGSKRLIVNYAGFNILLLVCYDIRFPVWSRNVDNEFDLLIYVANFPEKRINNWDILLQARAIENQCYVCGVNRIGLDNLGIKYNGHSVVLDFLGKTITACNEGLSEVATVTIDKNSLQQFRNKSPFWKDADTFELQ